jgi:hypothetical protein
MRTLSRHLPVILILTAASIIDAAVYAASDWTIVALPVSLQLALWGLLLWSHRAIMGTTDA